MRLALMQAAVSAALTMLIYGLAAWLKHILSLAACWAQPLTMCLSIKWKACKMATVSITLAVPKALTCLTS